jgi:hypothetical protein
LSDRLSLLTQAVESLFKEYFCSRLTQINSISLAVSIPARSNTPGWAKSCAAHGTAGFDVRTGQSYCDPKRFRAKAYPVNVEPGASVVKGPYVAETIAASVESDYLVVDL